MTDTLTLPPDVLATLRADLATRPDFDPPASARACTSPIHLVGESRTVHGATGEVLRVFSSDQLPGHQLSVACGNRRETVCPACSRVYAADAYQLIASGLLGGKGVRTSVVDNPRLFVTFTAPSFGPVHLGPDKDGTARPCHPRRDGSGCNRWHKTGDPAIGTPVNPDTYDYASAVLWNASASALWRRFTINLRRDLARTAGLTLTEFRQRAVVGYAKVAEYQARGAIHFHAVIRLDGPDGPGSPAPSWATAELLEQAIRSAASRSEVTTLETDDQPSMPVAFGRQLDVRPIVSSDLGSGQLSDSAVAGYIAKYATKSAHASGALDQPVYCRPCSGTGTAGTYRHDDDQERPRICRRCLGTGLGFDLADLRVSKHIRTLIETAWQLGEIPEFAPLKLRRWAHMLGFRGHFLTKARSYSTTFAVLREARREHARQETRDYLQAFGLLDVDTDDDTETLVIGSWSYAGRSIKLAPAKSGGGSHG